jgi:hypothetical protein
MIGDIIKHSLAERQIAKEHKKKEQRGFELPVRSVGVILDNYDAKILKDLSCLKDRLGILEQDFKVVVFEKTSGDLESLNMESYAWKDVNFLGRINNFKFNTLTVEGVDLLITFALENNVAVNLLTASSNAGLKVGRSTIKEELHDIVIHSEDSNVFVEELLNYLKRIKKEVA